MTVIFAAMYAYVGPKSLSSMAREWGVELAAEPGGEVDPGLLQFKRLPPDINLDDPQTGTTRPNEHRLSWRRGMSSRIVYDDEFGDLRTPDSNSSSPSTSSATPDPTITTSTTPTEKQPEGITAERANSTFVRALLGAIYLHSGRAAAKTFFKEHFLSRQLDMANLFNFSQPTRDLSRLCAREGFEAPIAKIISETGRLSRHPVFVVGIFSGADKLGEGAGGSLDEARFRAAVAALKGWYLYSPIGVRVPSSMEEEGAKPWRPAMVALGEVIV
jgi:dsRNA-specific ribonuclease